LLTTAQRGKALLPADEFYAVTLQKIIKQEASATKAGVTIVTYKIDKKIPNDTGRLEFTDGSKTYRFEVAEFDPDNAQRVSETDNLVVYFDPDSAPPDKKSPEKLTLPLAAKVFLRHNRPQPPTTSDLLDRIQFQLQQIQFNQLRNPSSP
jgi:hypothetical protein